MRGIPSRYKLSYTAVTRFESERQGKVHLISTMVSGKLSSPVSGNTRDESPAIIELMPNTRRGSSFANAPGTTSPCEESVENGIHKILRI